MTKVRDLVEPQWSEWVASRPAAVRSVCEKYPPDRLYSLAPNGQRVTIYSYSEDGTVTVEVSGRYNFTMFDRQVFGINPADLTECELPPDGELTGTMLTEEADIEAFVDTVRPAILAARGKP